MNALSRLYIFDYGGPVIAVYVEDDSVVVYRNFTDEKLLQGMATVAMLLRRFRGVKFFSWSNYVGYFGRNFIGVGYISHIKYGVFVLGFIRRLVSRLDAIEATFVDQVIRIVLDEIRKVIKLKEVSVI
mgnify:CR=1 FL=1